ncbi:MAG: hypothetical protein AB7F64_04700 [Gammaproteobacteria bacterium]
MPNRGTRENYAVIHIWQELTSFGHVALHTAKHSVNLWPTGDKKDIRLSIVGGESLPAVLHSIDQDYTPGRRGANWRKHDNNQNTLFHKCNNVAILTRLNDELTDNERHILNAQNSTGETPLHQYVRYQNIACITVLLQHHIDISLKNHQGQAAQDCATPDFRDTLSELLRTHGYEEHQNNRMCIIM